MGNHNETEPGRRDRKHITGTTHRRILALIHRNGHDRASIERAASSLRST